ncbi:MAG TPA: alkaline phosphatase family protein [Minicystis sp.]|nr:alkaline phosphatase family protein [Minicystis sp.]
MRSSLGFLAIAAACLAACGGASTSDSQTGSGGASTGSSRGPGSGGGGGGTGGTMHVPCGGHCPAGTTCGSANGLDVCRAPSGIPRFSSVFVIVMENTSLSTLKSAMDGGQAPNLKSLAGLYATGADYHGVEHPSLPNYVALTSGDTQGIGCDCQPAPGQGSCNFATCNLAFGDCSCNVMASNLADQLDTAGISWAAFGEDMGPPCNTTDAGNYAVRHVPFLYYDDVRTDMARCNQHVIDFTQFTPERAAFSYVAPNLVDDMHDPFPASTQNIQNGDTWIGPQVMTIVGSSAWKTGGLLVVVWDEDDDSGGVSGSDDPIPIFVASPYAKGEGYVSMAKADHYSLLATIEDGLGLPRLGKAGMMRQGMADTLADFFPDN